MGDPRELLAQAYFDHAPEAVALVESKTCALISCNRKFQNTVGPSKTLLGLDFVENCIQTEERTRFKIALENVIQDKPVSDISGDASDLEEWKQTPTIRDCSTLVLGRTNDFPIWRRYDWTLSKFDDKHVIMSGRMSIMDPASASVAHENTGQPSERELLDFLNKAPIAMHWLSGTGHVLWANETELNILGYTAEEYIGQPIMNFCPDEKELVLEIFKTLGSGNTIKDVPVRFRDKKGKIRDLLIDSNVNWNPDGTFKHTRCFIRDDTGRKIREERLRVTREKEQQLAKAKDIFVRKTFHEIRTPCHILWNHVAILEEQMKEMKLATSFTEAFGVAKLQTNRLLRIANDAADVTMFEMGKVPVLKVNPFSIKETIADICSELEEHGLSQDVVCSVVLGEKEGEAVPFSQVSKAAFKPDKIPDSVMGDARHLKRVLHHLLENSIRVTSKGSIKLTVGFWPASQDMPNRYCFTVTDTGPGIEELKVQECFHKYWTQVTLDGGAKKEFDDLSRDQHGLGLGLNVSFHLVQCLGGQLECSSSLGQGATFRFTVPFPAAQGSNMERSQEQFANLSVGDSSQSVPSWTDVTASGEAMRHIVAEARETAEVNLPPAVGISNELKRRPHVLIVDDNSVCLKVARRMFEDLKCTTEVASHGLQAFMIVKENPSCFDMILMDLRMPVMDGVEATRKIRQELQSDIPIVAFTAEMMEQEVLNESGFNSIINKPATKGILSSHLFNLVINKTGSLLTSLMQEKKPEEPKQPEDKASRKVRRWTGRVLATSSHVVGQG
uniref:Histidine kinase n=1 Tax=Guillardia theta TaxID=55529 RepID=A0A6U6BI43_GUITH|mmetsp:Transcript_37789/g.119376  ORF Transcript_37789/g.119376 Transcript_37789/m.119376 type:complete len:785 (+) Transcript_37789:43-2397(+)